MLQSDRAILFGNAKTERLVQMLSNYPQASMPGRPKEKLASDQFAQKILQDAAAARGKGDDRFDNLASFARLLQKALNNPSWYSLGPTSWPESRYAPKDGRTFIERLPGRVDKNITSTTEWLLPLIQLAEDRAHPGRRHFHLQIHNELLEMAAKTRERLSAYLFHVN